MTRTDALAGALEAAMRGGYVAEIDTRTMAERLLGNPDLRAALAASEPPTPSPQVSLSLTPAGRHFARTGERPVEPVDTGLREALGGLREVLANDIETLPVMDYDDNGDPMVSRTAVLDIVRPGLATGSEATPEPDR